MGFFNWAAKIKVSTGSIALYENGVLRYAEPYALPSNNCRLYAYPSSNINGTGAFDNFELKPAEIFQFNGGKLNGWVSDSGNWGVQNGRLQSSTYYGHMHFNKNFSANRHVRADIQTLSSDGVNQWDVAWLMVNEQDGNNMVYALIRTDGKVELSVYKDGVRTTLDQVQSSNPTLSPFGTHSLAVSIVGSNAKVWVDGKLYNDVTDNHLPSIAGYAGLYTPSSTAAFNSVAAFDENTSQPTPCLRVGCSSTLYSVAIAAHTNFPVYYNNLNLGHSIDTVYVAQTDNDYVFQGIQNGLFDVGLVDRVPTGDEWQSWLQSGCDLQLWAIGYNGNPYAVSKVLWAVTNGLPVAGTQAAIGALWAMAISAVASTKLEQTRLLRVMCRELGVLYTLR